MTALPTFSRRARWAVPAGAVAIAGAVTAGVLISAAASASPELPVKTPAQLLAGLAARTGPPPALTGTVVETASLGIPQLPSIDNQNSAISLLAGSHTVKVWYADPAHFRLSMPVTMSETDVIRNGRQAWLWQSSTNSVTKLTLPAHMSAARSGAAASATPSPSQVPLTPQQAASQVLKIVGKSTRVSVQRTVTVAGQPAYQLVLSPKSSGSLIGRVNIAIDASNNVPLRVQVFARGGSSPAFQVGYTLISFVRPAAANFTFSPPPGAKVKTVTVPSDAAGKQRPSAAERKAAGQFQVIGKDWLSVAVLPASVLSQVTGGSAAAAASQAAQSAVPGGPAGGGSGETAAILHTLVGAATPVHGAWGSGRLLHTSLVNMLITDNGHVLIGAVTAPVLENAAAQVK
jgi:outer membrane lipoprotein-sorting protein